MQRVLLTTILVLAMVPVRADPDSETPRLRPLVHVVFELKSYEKDYPEPKRSKLFGLVLAELPSMLEKSLPCFDFTAEAPPENAGAPSIHVRLAPGDLPGDVNFELSVRDEEGTRIQTDPRSFLNQNDPWRGHGNPENLGPRIARIFRARFLRDDSARRELVRCLGEVALCRKADRIRKKTFLLPLRCRDFFLHERLTRFRIHVRIESPPETEGDEPIWERRTYVATAAGPLDDRGILARVVELENSRDVEKDMEELIARKVEVVEVSLHTFVRGFCGEVIAAPPDDESGANEGDGE